LLPGALARDLEPELDQAADGFTAATNALLERPIIDRPQLRGGHHDRNALILRFIAHAGYDNQLAHVAQDGC
jgi:hypothetical protein